MPKAAKVRKRLPLPSPQPSKPAHRCRFGLRPELCGHYPECPIRTYLASLPPSGRAVLTTSRLAIKCDIGKLRGHCVCQSPSSIWLQVLRMWSEITSPICTGGFGRTASLQDACLASCTARIAPSRASQLLGAKRGVIPDHILSMSNLPTCCRSLPPDLGWHPSVNPLCSLAVRRKRTTFFQLIWQYVWSLTGQVFAYLAQNSNIQRQSSRGRNSYKFKLAPTVCVGVAPSRRWLLDSCLSSLGYIMMLCQTLAQRASLRLD